MNNMFGKKVRQKFFHYLMKFIHATEAQASISETLIGASIMSVVIGTTVVLQKNSETDQLRIIHKMEISEILTNMARKLNDSSSCSSSILNRSRIDSIRVTHGNKVSEYYKTMDKSDHYEYKGLQIKSYTFNNAQLTINFYSKILGTQQNQYLVPKSIPINTLLNDQNKITNCSITHDINTNNWRSDGHNISVGESHARIVNSIDRVSCVPTMEGAFFYHVTSGSSFFPQGLYVCDGSSWKKIKSEFFNTQMTPAQLDARFDLDVRYTDVTLSSSKSSASFNASKRILTGVTAGDVVNVSFNWVMDAVQSYCPGCISPIIVGIIGFDSDGNALYINERNQSSSCAYGGGSVRTMVGSHPISGQSFTIPNVSGLRELFVRIQTGWVYNCSDIQINRDRDATNYAIIKF